MAETLQDRLLYWADKSGWVMPATARETMREAAAKLDELENRISRPDGVSEEEKVIAEYRDENGNLMWMENPYLFRRKFGVGQSVISPDKTIYGIIRADFVGEFGHGIINYVVKPRHPEISYVDLKKKYDVLVAASTGGEDAEDSQDLSGWIMGDSEGRRWRGWGNYGPTWQTDPMKAIRFARRKDAEAVFAEDEDAWTVIELAAAIRSQKDGE